VAIFDLKHSTEQAEMLRVYETVRNYGVPNFMGARIPLKHGLNMDRWEALLQGYHDKDILSYLRYGWPINYTTFDVPHPTWENHKSGYRQHSR
jgi:hypothetical protein